MDEKLPRILPKVATSTSLLGSFTCRKFTTWDRRLYFPSEGRRAEDFFARKIRPLRPGLNPRTWVPKASTRRYQTYYYNYMIPGNARSHKNMTIALQQKRPYYYIGIAEFLLLPPATPHTLPHYLSLCSTGVRPDHKTQRQSFVGTSPLTQRVTRQALVPSPRGKSNCRSVCGVPATTSSNH